MVISNFEVINPLGLGLAAQLGYSQLLAVIACVDVHGFVVPTGKSIALSHRMHCVERTTTEFIQSITELTVAMISESSTSESEL